MIMGFWLLASDVGLTLFSLVTHRFAVLDCAPRSGL